MANSESYRVCFVPKCTNTTVKTPDKLFFSMPMDMKVRKKWFQLARREDPIGKINKYYCCEDHFKVSRNIFYNIKTKNTDKNVLRIIIGYSF